MYLFNDACLFSRAITCPLREYPPIKKKRYYAKKQMIVDWNLLILQKKNDYDLKTYYVKEMLC